MASSLEQRVSKHDREIAAIRKLVLTGMKMLVHSERQHREHFLRMEGADFELRQRQIAFREDLRLMREQQQAAHEENQREHREFQRELRLMAAETRKELRDLKKTVDAYIRGRGRNGGNGHSR